MLPVAPPADGLPPRTEPITELSARRMGPLRRFFHRHPAAMDWVVALWFGLPSTALLIWGTPADTLDERILHGVLCLAAVVALLRRRHEPVVGLAAITGATILAYSLLGDSIGLEFAGVLALYAVAAHRPPVTAWLCLTGFNAVHAAVYALWAATPVTVYDEAGNATSVSPVQAFWIVASTTLTLSVIALALGAAARGRRQHISGLVERTAQLALERDQREQIALTAERNRIAREMHDVVAHSLSVMIALADGAGAALSKRPEQARVALDELASTGRSALADTRRLLGVLREDDTGEATDDDGAPLTPQPTTPDLSELVARFQAAGLPVTFTESGPPLPADAGLQLTVFRIVQEALTNVLRHAPGASRIDATVERHRGYVVVEVDNADGASSVAHPGGRGLVGMRERAAAYDGHVDAGATATGWRVRAVLRWVEEEL